MTEGTMLENDHSYKLIFKPFFIALQKNEDVLTILFFRLNL